MDIIGKIRPINENHSIKEASISVFLANPILKPERFKELIEKEFKDIFQQFEEIGQVQLQIKQEQGVVENSTPQITKNIGFRFTGFDKGKVVKVLQGVNEINRTFISFHSFNYLRWENFYKEYLEKISVIANNHTELFVNAFSLHYIDQFVWLDESNPMNLEMFFNKESSYLPNELFNSVGINYQLTTQKDIDNIRYFDRLEIQIIPTKQPILNISHNVTIPLKNLFELKELLKSPDLFARLLDVAHQHNKDILNNILIDFIKELIKLK